MGMGYRIQTSVTWKIKVQIQAFIQASVTPAQTFAGKKIKNPLAVKNVFFLSLELEVGTYINLYSFESSMK